MAIQGKSVALPLPPCAIAIATVRAAERAIVGDDVVVATDVVESDGIAGGDRQELRRERDGGTAELYVPLGCANVARDEQQQHP